jgi:predicted nucleic acid-binding protein
MIFLDTNILLYTISNASEEARKCQIARDLLDRSDVALSVQVLQEFYVQATRASRTGALPHDLAVQFIGVWQRFPIQPMDMTVMQKALAVKARYQFSYWDSAIIAAAGTMGCKILFSENMQHGFELNGLKIINPFL